MYWLVATPGGTFTTISRSTRVRPSPRHFRQGDWMIWGSVLNALLAVVALRFYAADPAWVQPRYPDASRYNGYPEIVDLNEVSPDPTGQSEWDANVGARMLYKMTAWMLASQGKRRVR